MLYPLLVRSTHQRLLLLQLKQLLKQCERNFNSESCSIPLMATGEAAGLPLKDVVSKLDTFAPKSLAESWDNVGLLIEPATKRNIKKIILTNDLTEDVMDEALEVKADLIISYHPPIFSPLKSVTSRTWKERIVAQCLENRIALYSPHTSFDAISGGVNDWLASAFESTSVNPVTTIYVPNSTTKPFQVEINSQRGSSRTSTVLEQIKNEILKISTEALLPEIKDGSKLNVNCSKDSLSAIAGIFHKLTSKENKEVFTISKFEDVPLPGIGMGRLCCLARPLDVMTVVNLVKKHIQLPHVRLALARYKNIESPVSKIALCAGSGVSVLRGVDADLYLTGEMGHHDVLDAVHKGVHLILCDHSNTERGFLRVFANKLAVEILDKKVEVVVSKVDRDPLQVI